MNSLIYTHKCPVCSPVNKLEITPMLNQHEVVMFLDMVYRGIYNKENLPTDFYIKTAKLLEDELNKGFGDTTNENQKELYNKLRSNLYYFSAAKTYHLVNLLEAEKDKPKNEFSTVASGLLGLFIGDYFAVEKQSTYQSSFNAKKWTKYQKRKTLPYLEYVTMKDGRVRPAHAVLDGIIRELNDIFWKTFLPPNGWLCRCKVKTHANGVNTDLKDFDMEEALYNVPPVFRNNSGISGEVFTNKHPYFKVPKEDKELARNNFNLPLPHNYK